MRIRHGEVICEGTVESVKNLERLLSKHGDVLHDGSKGRNILTGDYTPRSAFSRVYEMRVNGDVLRLTLWYDKRDGTARVRALPVHMTKLRKFIPEFGQRLWEVAKSGEGISGVIIPELASVSTPENIASHAPGQESAYFLEKF